MNPNTLLRESAFAAVFVGLAIVSSVRSMIPPDYGIPTHIGGFFEMQEPRKLREIQMELLEAKAAREESDRLCAVAYNKLDPADYRDWQWFAELYRPQSMIFYSELFPTLFDQLSKFQCGQNSSVLDVGGGSGAGTQLLAQMFRSGLSGYTGRFTVIDIDPVWQSFSEVLNGLVDYIVGDVFQVKDKSFDIVVCSHTIEHIREDFASSFVRKCVAICRKFALFYAPFEERDLIPGHLFSITNTFLTQFKPCFLEIRNSAGWQKAGEKSRCAIFVCAAGQDI